ncbi:inhibitor of apoptosis-promoting bax1 domain-containing protein [Ditylenchus destructor]|uniref:Inhibitor of apoptosis-promoting bax1 domain-containing protein n=1 Tax=Ditylenchus destructor TaxID=166010 RepID=A0AAD4RAC8_9BILA|nr:inhibitor of apoptosis-promoting bax1 domain-containing protein [Ditylenchus destructor]
MLSRLANPAFHNSSVALKSGTAAILARHFVTTTLRNARTAGFRAKTFSEQFAFKARTTVAPTLRERLLGPTTGKPYVYGTYALAGASVFGVGMLCYYGLGMSKEINAFDRSALWPAYVRQRLQTTYGYLTGSLALTAAAGMAAARSPMIMRLTSTGSLWAFLGSLALIVGTGTIARSIPYENTMAKHVAWAAHSGVLGAVLAPLCVLGGPALLRAAWYTAGLVAGLSATAICAPSEKFLNMAGPLAMGLGVVFVANIGSFFFPPHTALGAGLASVVVYGGLILFSAFLLYDTQKIIRAAETTPQGGGFDPINAQMSLYMDIMNIFIRIAMLVGGGGQRRK